MAESPLLGLSQRQPPANLQAEQALLGAILSNNRAIERVEAFLQPEHFADPVNGRIFGEVMRLTSSGRVADAVTLKTVFENSGVLDDVGGTAYLAQLLTAMVGIINAGEYGHAIHDAWMRRNLIEIGETMVNNAFGADPTLDAAAQIEATDRALMDLTLNGGGDLAPTVSGDAAVRRAIASSRAAMLRGDGLAGPTTGYRGIDRMIGGLQSEILMLLGGRPGMGKSAMALGISVRAAAALRDSDTPDKRVLFWSGEMPEVQIGTRIVSAHSGLPTTAVTTGHLEFPIPGSAPPAVSTRPLGRAEWSRIALAGDASGGLPLEFDTRPGITVAALRSRARRMKRGKGGLALIVVDYVQLMSCSPALRARSRYEQITEISRDLMELKAELKVPILALVQLNRGIEGREEKLPQLADLRDSGALEQDANIVMLVHRSHYYLTRAIPQRKPNENDAEFSIRHALWEDQVTAARGKAVALFPKNRMGGTGSVPLYFEDHTTWFRDMADGEFGPAWQEAEHAVNG